MRLTDLDRADISLFSYYVWNGTLPCFRRARWPWQRGWRWRRPPARFDYRDELLATPDLLPALYGAFLARLGASNFWDALAATAEWIDRVERGEEPVPRVDGATLTPPWKRTVLALSERLVERTDGRMRLAPIADEGGGALQQIFCILVNVLELDETGTPVDAEAALSRALGWLRPGSPPFEQWELEIRA